MHLGERIGAHYRSPAEKKTIATRISLRELACIFKQSRCLHRVPECLKKPQSPAICCSPLHPARPGREKLRQQDKTKIRTFVWQETRWSAEEQEEQRSASHACVSSLRRDSSGNAIHCNADRTQRAALRAKWIPSD